MTSASDPLPTFDVAELQRWFFHAVTSPSAPDDAPLPPGFSHDVVSRPVEDVILPSATLSPPERVKIYSNMYFWRVLGSLVDDFTVVHSLMGPERFEQTVRAYLVDNPSRTYTLLHTGRAMPDYLATLPSPDAALLSDIARVEDAVNAAFGALDAPTLNLNTLQTLPPDRWADARFDLDPSVKLLALRHPANKLINAVRDGASIPDDLRQPRDTFVIVWRNDLDVWRLTISRPRFALLSALANGDSMGDALSAAADAWTDPDDALEDHVFTWFSEWIGEGYFSALRL